MKSSRDERRTWLAARVAADGVMHVAEAARHCGVSQMTIRRDVEASDGELTLLAGRLFASARLPSNARYDLAAEADSHVEIKRALGARAAAIVEPDDTIFVDCGSTLVHLVDQLDPALPVTIVTYALNVANAASRLPRARLVLRGGLYHASSQSFVDEAALEALRHTGINKAFISAAGVDVERGISCFNFHETAAKRAALAVARQRVLVADASKIGRLRPALFADWRDFDTFFTESGPAGIDLPAGPAVIRVTRPRQSAGERAD